MKWINVKDRLPEKGENVLSYDGKTIYKSKYWPDDNKWIISDACCCEDLYNITHWMPLPEPPKDNE